MVKEDDTLKLELDPNPTPKAESKEFSNPDDIRRGQELAHELALLDRQQGWLGKAIGSTDSNLTIAFTVGILLIVLCIGCLIGMGLQPEASYYEALKTLGASLLTVMGYIFGVKSSGK